MELVFKILLMLSCVILIASILLQQGNSAGLSSAIGGGAEQLFGKKKGRGMEKFLKRITFVFAVIFIFSSLIIVIWEPKLKSVVSSIGKNEEKGSSATDSALTDAAAADTGITTAAQEATDKEVAK
jgi:preprotein translocase subunit SecG